MKSAILFYSQHHQNTEKLVKAVAQTCQVDVFDILQDVPDLSQYSSIGFASGIYMGNFHQKMIDCILEMDGKGKNAFFMYTCGSPKGNYGSKIEALLKGQNFTVVGGFHCRGYDTYGPFKLIGGMAKGHPNLADEKAAIEFYQKMEEGRKNDTDKI